MRTLSLSRKQREQMKDSKLVEEPRLALRDFG